MDKETLERIERIELELAEIDKRIAALQRRRGEVLWQDAEYADYVEQYRAYFTDEPSSIRSYYKFSAELEKICQAIRQAEPNAQEIYRQHGNRLAYLERVLAA